MVIRLRNIQENRLGHGCLPPPLLRPRVNLLQNMFVKTKLISGQQCQYTSKCLPNAHSDFECFMTNHGTFVRLDTLT